MHKLPQPGTPAAPHVLPSDNVVVFPNTRASGAKERKDRREDGIALTKATVKKLALPAGKADVVYWDNALTGFGLRIRAGGKRVYMVQFRDASGATRKVTIGDANMLDADDARTAARKLLGAVAVGNDPAKVKREARQAVKFGDLVRPYLAHAKDRQKASTFTDTRRNLEQHARSLDASPIKEIDRSAISRLHEKITTRNGPVQANRVLAALSAMFSWAIGKGHIDINPVLSVPKNAEAPRERALTDEEIRAIWKATEPDGGPGDDYARIVRLLLLTGTRRSEVGDMHWEELSNNLWTIPGERMKNSLPHEVWMTERALSALERPSSAPDSQSSFVFGKLERSGFSGWSKAKARLDRRLGLDGWGLHDFRRTMSTRLHEGGVQPHVVEALLAHISGHKAGVAGTYNRASYRDQKREALELWATMIAAIVKGDAT